MIVDLVRGWCRRRLSIDDPAVKYVRDRSDSQQGHRFKPPDVGNSRRAHSRAFPIQVVWLRQLPAASVIHCTRARDCRHYLIQQVPLIGM